MPLISVCPRNNRAVVTERLIAEQAAHIENHFGEDDPVMEREHLVDKLAIAEYKASDMGDKSITKVSAATAPRGPMGQKYLASGIRLSM